MLKGGLLFISDNIQNTPISENINLNTGVYFVTLVINGRNEYHKIIVQ